MFNLLKEKDNSFELRMFKVLMNVNNYRVMGNEEWKAIRFLNKRGLIKYFLTEEKNVITIMPTLLCLYLTKKKKYGIEKAYKEAVDLYEMIGEGIINVKETIGSVLSKR